MKITRVVQVPDDPPIEQPTEEVDDTSRIIVASGKNVSLHVRDGQLRIEDGNHRTRNRHIRILNRATTQAKRILVLGQGGMISLPVLWWCEKVGIHLVILNQVTGNPIIQTQSSSMVDGRLRRAQALAPFDTEEGLEITRFLQGMKLAGQRDNLIRLGYDVPGIDDLCDRATHGESLEEVLQAEMVLAKIYFDCLAVLRVPVAAKRQSSIQQHWLTFGPRLNPKTNSPRAATTPANSILNFCYALAEIETVIALHSVGLDPWLGIVHDDTQTKHSRHSMALDCIEAIRPDVDAYVLGLLNAGFHRDDFAEGDTGVVYLSGSLRSELAESMPLWAEKIAPVAEHVANTLRPADMLGRKVNRTPLTKMGYRWRSSGGQRRLTSTVISPERRRQQWEPLYLKVRSADTRTLMDATGWTRGYINQIKRGTRIPDQRHWPTIRKALGPE